MPEILNVGLKRSLILRMIGAALLPTWGGQQIRTYTVSSVEKAGDPGYTRVEAAGGTVALFWINGAEKWLERTFRCSGAAARDAVLKREQAAGRWVRWT